VLFGFRFVASMKASVHFVDTNNARSDFTACGVITHSIHWTWCCVSRRNRHRAAATTKAGRASDCLLLRRRRFMMS
jgi:hypothetical protein